MHLLSGVDVTKGTISFPDDDVAWIYGDYGVTGVGVSYYAAGDVTGDGTADLFAYDYTGRRGVAADHPRQ
jgi:hypothetical protein